MTAHERDHARERRGILGWLGLRPARHSRDGNKVPEWLAEEDAQAATPREMRQRQLLDEITGFLLGHRLDVTPYTLVVAHDAKTGSDARLAQMILHRVQSGHAVTLEWLEEAGRECGRNDGVAALDALMARLEASIDDLAGTARDARSATSDYSTALEAHVVELAQVEKAGAVITELAAITRAMLDRTRTIEQEMSRSENRTLELQKSLDEARRKAEVDHLTGLPNRRAFESALEREYAAAQAAGEPLCVAFCDIDHFKRVNDTHGHDAGDRVLRAVAQTLAKISDDRCHVARHGGEEFVVLLRGRTLDEAWAVLDRARESMAQRKLVNRSTDVAFGRITFSAGLADVFAHESARMALKAADNALYLAKAQGRNMVVRDGEQGERIAA